MLCQLSTLNVTTYLQLSYTPILPTLVHTTDHVPFLLVHQVDPPNVVPTQRTSLHPHSFKPRVDLLKLRIP
jgi:hypothetical protein